MEDGKACIIILLSIFGAVWLADVIHEENIKMQAFDEAVNLSKEKGIINMGATGNLLVATTREIAKHPAIRVNVDLKADNTPKFFPYNLEVTPYPWADKEFDVAFAAHILEHLDNWEGALREWIRIADYTIVVLPYPFLHGWFSPAHKQHFTFQNIEGIRGKYPVKIYV